MIKIMNNEDNNSGNNPHDIIDAAYQGNSGLVASLLTDGADVNAVDQEDNLSILHIAALQGDLMLAKVVVEHNAIHGDVDFGIKSRHRPRLAWQFAANSNHWELARLIDEASRSSPRSGEPYAHNKL